MVAHKIIKNAGYSNAVKGQFYVVVDTGLLAVDIQAVIGPAFYRCLNKAVGGVGSSALSRAFQASFETGGFLLR